MQPQDDNIFQEVNQSLREETIAKVWKRWQWVVYGAIALAVGTVGVMEIMRWQRNEEIASAARTYDAAFAAGESGDLPTARARLLELKDSKTGFAALSGLMLAGVEQDLTNDPAAVESHLRNAAAADKGVLGDLATIKLAYLKADTASAADLDELLRPLIDRDNTASRLASELLASKLIAEGKLEPARDILETLKNDVNAPANMRQRVDWTLASLPARVVDLNAPASPASSTAPTPATPAPATPAAPAPAPAQPQQ